MYILFAHFRYIKILNRRHFETALKLCLYGNIHSYKKNTFLKIYITILKQFSFKLKGTGCQF